MTIKKPQKILVVEVNWIGDVLFTTPFIHSLKEYFPQSHISCLIVPRCVEMIKNNPDIDEIIPFDEKGKDKSILAKIRTIQLLRRKAFDTVFFCHRSSTRMAMAKLAKIPTLIGFKRNKTDWLLTKKVVSDPSAVHRVEHFMRLAYSVGITKKPANYLFPITKEARDEARALLDKFNITKKDRIIALNPGANWKPKRWQWERFARLADKCIKELGVKIILTGADKDKELGGHILRSMQYDAYSACGKTSLTGLAALFKESQLVVSNDSGPLHIAASTSTPLIALFGPTSPEMTGPYGSGKIKVLSKVPDDLPVPCYDQRRDTVPYMQALTVDYVFENIKKLISH